MQGFGAPVVVAVNRFAADTDAEIARVKELCIETGAPCCAHELHARGGEGGLELAETAYDLAAGADKRYTPLYPLDMPLKEKIETIATRIYRAEGVRFEPAAARSLRSLTRLGYGELPVCIAKTQASLSDNPKKTRRAGGLHGERARGQCVGGGGVRGRHRGEHHADARPRENARLGGNGHHRTDGRITGLF